MKIILSRKGFDAGSGGFPSPVLPDGRLCSLPIPRAGDRPARDIRFDRRPLAELIVDLTGVRTYAEAALHLDPDLRRESVPRAPGWRPCFGQAGAAQGHLAAQGVGAGDLFLFFGWFRDTEVRGGRLRFKSRAPDRHVLFGWLQVESVHALSARTADVPAWAATHPHVANASSYATNNTLYVATRRLRLPGMERKVAGAGVFERLARRRVLTADGRSRSIWRLPPFFHPGRLRVPLSFHGNAQRWTPDTDSVLLKTVGRGQEFVLDAEGYPEAVPWLRTLYEDTPR